MASINYAVTNNWGAGFIGNMTVPGGDHGLNGWTLAFDASFDISNIWGAEIVSHVGSHYIVRSLSWNSSVPAGGQVTFGFQATPGAGGAAASGLSLNGGDTAPPPLPTLSIAAAPVIEGNAGTSTLAFKVTLSQPATGSVKVNYATADGTAVAGSDYTAQSGTLTFAAGETSKTVNVVVAGDTAVEANETLTLKLSSVSGATIAAGSATGTIVNDDVAPPPSIRIGDASVIEGTAAAPGHAAFTVTLSAASTSAVTVNFATADGTATAGSDYVAQSGSLSFAPGETQKTIQIAAIGDSVVEADEGFTVVLSKPVGATIADGTGAGTIVNDDIATPPPGLPTLSISDTSVIEGNPGTGAAASGWLSTSGNQIVDAAGHSVQIAGVNWFGFESSNLAPHGLWTRGYKDMMNQMVELGFNTIRLPFSSEMLHSTAAPNGIDFSKSPDLQGLSSLQIMDKIVDYAGQIGLKIILDHHRSESGAGTSGNGLWYDGQYSDAQWVSDWKMLATRYANKPAVIGADLHNEPYNGTWGGGGPNDWAAAAERAGNAIGTVNPNWLVFVEGVGTYKGDSYWWGGNLEGVKDRPINLNVGNKLVYSPHDYPNSVYPQSWFQGANFAQQLPAKFDQEWGYIYREGIAPVYVGEFGTKLSDPKDAPWLEAITSYMSGDLNNDGTSDIPATARGVSWTYWAWNPNSGDTGGILADDWRSVNQAKLDYLKPIEFDFGTDVVGGGTGPVAGAHADFLLTLSQPATQAVTVGFHTVAGDATSADFTASQGTVSFAPGERSKTISIPITPDTLGEANEHFTVVLTDAAGATLARTTGTATIVDDDGGVVGPPPVVPNPPGPTDGGNLHAAFSVANSWYGGFNGGVTLHNDGASATAGWQVEVDMPFQMTDLWNAQIISHDASGYVIGNAAWNGTIAHGGDTTFGFVASGQGDPSTTRIGHIA
jgi:chitinase